MSVRSTDERQRRRHAEWVRSSITRAQATNTQFFYKAFDSLPTPQSTEALIRQMQITKAEERASTGVLGQVVGMRDLAMIPDPPDDGGGGPNEMALLAGAASAAVLVGAVRAAMNRWSAARTPEEKQYVMSTIDVQLQTLAAELQDMERSAAIQAEYVAELEAALRRQGQRQATQPVPDEGMRQVRAADRRARAEARLVQIRELNERSRLRAERRGAQSGA